MNPCSFHHFFFWPSLKNLFYVHYSLFLIFSGSTSKLSISSSEAFFIFLLLSLICQNTQLKRNNRARDEIQRIIYESKLEEPDQIVLLFVPNPICGSQKCDKDDCQSVNTHFKYILIAVM